MFATEATDAVLDDLVVVELSSAIAAPFAGKLLAENGATVIKVEPLWGESFRTRDYWYDRHGADDLTYRFLEYNTGKESVAVDLKTEAGVGVLWDLIDEADVLIENMTAGTFEGLGFPWEEMHERNPELIYCSITGYGEDGPYADRAAYDPVVQGVSSWVGRIGSNDDPRIMDLWIIDHATAMYAVAGILLALIERGSSGVGQRIDIAMLDVAVSFLGHPFAEYSASRAYDLEPIYRTGIEPQGVFEVADGYMGLIVVESAWEEFCEAVGREDWLEDPRFETQTDRVDNVDEIHDAVEDLLRERPREEWMDLLDEDAPEVITAPVNLFGDLPTDPQVEHRGLFLERDHPRLGEYYLPKPALRFSRSGRSLADAPSLGEDTGDVLSALGYGREEVVALREEGVID